jgi:hypothetical protein
VLTAVVLWTSRALGWPPVPVVRVAAAAERGPPASVWFWASLGTLAAVSAASVYVAVEHVAPLDRAGA